MLWLIYRMDTQTARDHILLMNDQPETLPPLVQVLEAKGYRVVVALTFRDTLAWLEVETPRCVIVQLSTLTATDIALLRARRMWAKRVPLVVVTPLPASAALRRALEDRTFIVVPYFASPDVLGHVVTTLAVQEETA